jgi:hypothetical protein
VRSKPIVGVGVFGDEIGEGLGIVSIGKPCKWVGHNSSGSIPVVTALRGERKYV